MLAARAASAPPSRMASARWSGRARPAAGHHGTETASATAAGDLQVVAVLGAVGVHRGEHDLAGAELLDLAGPGDGFPAGADPAAVDVDFPKLPARPSPPVWGRC